MRLADKKRLSLWCYSLGGFGLALVERDGGADKILERRLVDDIALMNIDGPARLGVKTGVEETVRIVQRCAFEHVDLDVIPECANGDDVSVVRPHWRIPFPFLDEVRRGVEDQFAKAREQLAAPVGKFLDVGGNSF